MSGFSLAVAEMNASMQQGAQQMFNVTFERLAVPQKLRVWDRVARSTLKEMSELDEQRKFDHVDAAEQAIRKGVSPLQAQEQLSQQLEAYAKTIPQRAERYSLLVKIIDATQKLLWQELIGQLEQNQKVYWVQRYHDLYLSGKPLSQRVNPSPRMEPVD